MSVSIPMRFEWDPNKAALNHEKHGISFTEAMTAFDDLTAAIFHDPKHSITEERKILVGNSRVNRMLLVSFTERGESIRIISARRPNKGEKKRHEDYQRNSESSRD